MQNREKSLNLQTTVGIENFFVSFPLGLILLDHRGIALEVNPQQLKQSKIKREDILGKKLLEVFSDVLKRYNLIEPLSMLFEKRIPFKIDFEEYQPQFYKMVVRARFWGFPLVNNNLNIFMAERVDIYKNIKPQEIVGANRTIEIMFDVIERASMVRVPTLIEGESGTGKEMVANSIHMSSKRKDKPLLAINCAALSSQILESTLFGHERGAFTDADRQFKGYFESANGGTLFLDEIADMAESTQAKLLRVLQDGMITRLGSTTPISTDVRIICATNKNMDEEIRTGRFRQDLYYRINVIQIRIPPLRERMDDLPLLINHYLDLFSKKHRFGKKYIVPEVHNIFINYSWPGNVRELSNVIESAYVQCREEAITIDYLPQRLIVERYDNSFKSIGTIPYREALTRFQKAYIGDIASRSNKDWKTAARMAGVNLSTIYRIKANIGRKGKKEQNNV
jgi:transcriptional regulator with PAS, ATPase and Fis domain